MWKVRMYMNTGFNSINVPDSEATLQAAASSFNDFPVIDCLQRYFLSSITIKAFEDDVIQGDYVKLWDDSNPNRFAFYSVDGYVMTSGDTIELNITMDSLLSCGGIDNIDFLDGMTVRHHLGDGEETPTEDDPYLIPQKITSVQIGEYCAPGQHPHGGEVFLILRSKYRLDVGSLEIEKHDGVEISFTENSMTGLMVTTPIIKSSGLDETVIRMHHGSAVTRLSDGTCLHILSCSNTPSNVREQIMWNIKKLIEYGRTDIILDAYYVPASFIVPGVTVSTVGSTTDEGMLLGVDNLAFSSETSVLGTVNNVYSEKSLAKKLPTSAYAYKPKNDRVFLGKNFSFTFIVRDSGDKVVVNPEDVKYSNQDVPRVDFALDLRTNGSVTYYVETRNMYGAEYEFEKEYDVVNVPPLSVESKQWDKADLVIMASNNVRNDANTFALNDMIANENVAVENGFSMTNKYYGLGALKLINPAEQISASIERSYWQDVANIQTIGGGDPFNDRIGYGTLYGQGNERAKAQFQRAGERQKEMQQFLQASIPKVNVMSTGSGSSVMKSAGLAVYRSMLSEEDVIRLDRILNQFGVKKTETLKHDMLNNRTHFNYVEASSVSVKCDTVPKSVRDDLASLFNGGVRIWHTKPDVDKYNDNPVKKAKEVTN